MSRRRFRTPVVLGLAIAALAVAVSPVAAVFDPQHQRGTGLPGLITLSGLGPGQPASGGIAPAAFDPLDGYPASPPSGSTPANEGFAGVIEATSNTDPPQTLQMYCIDLRTSTWIGLSYHLGSWDATNVPNVERVARLLNDYYPTTGEPSGAANDAERAAAVQAAIWFLTDRFVLDADSSLRPLTAAIVTDVLAKPALPEPSLPLSISGPASGTAGAVIGPFTIDTTADEVTIHVTGGQLFRNAAGTNPIADGETIPSTTKVFLVAPDPGSATITLQATIVAPSGRALLYAAADPDNPNPPQAQKLILAGTGIVNSTTDTVVEILAPEQPTPTPTATSTGGVEPATSTPGPTAPATSTITPVTPSSPSPRSLLVIGAALVFAGLALMVGTRRRRPRRGGR